MGAFDDSPTHPRHVYVPRSSSRRAMGGVSTIASEAMLLLYRDDVVRDGENDRRESRIRLLRLLVLLPLLWDCFGYTKAEAVVTTNRR
jgi:hypothetical protein